MLRVLFLFLFLFLFLSPAYSLDLGVGVHSNNFSDIDEFSNLLKENNVTSVRTDFPWSQVEYDKGVYHFPNDKYHKFINQMISDDISLVLILGYGNKIYENFSSVNPKMKPTNDTSIAAFVNYASWAASNIKSRDIIFEVWNEWIQLSGKGNRDDALSDNSAMIYSKLVNASCEAIKKENPQSKVIAGGISTFDSDSIEWIEKVISNGGMDCVDGISIHPYDFSKNSQLSAQRTIRSIANFHKILLQKFHKDYALYITEIGVPDGVSYNKTESDVANYLNDFLHLTQSYNYIKGIWWYDFINDGDDPLNRENNFGLLRQDKTPKMSADIFKKFSSSLKSK